MLSWCVAGTVLKLLGSNVFSCFNPLSIWDYRSILSYQVKTALGEKGPSGETHTPERHAFCQGQDGFPVSWDFTSSSVFTSFCASICSHLKKRVYTEAPNRLFSCLLLQNRKIIWWETFLNAVGYVRSELFPPKHLKWRTIPHHYPRLCILLVQRNCPQCQQGRLLASKMALSLDCFSLET